MMGVAKVKHDGSLLGTQLGTSLGYQDGTELESSDGEAEDPANSSKLG